MPLNIPRIFFNPKGKPLTVEIEFPTLQIVSYTVTLKEAGSNTRAMRKEGDNTNAEDDKHELPTPVSINGKRSLLFYAAFIDPGENIGAPYEAIAIVKQGNTVRGKLTVAGTMNGRSEHGSDWAKLIAKAGV